MEPNNDESSKLEEVPLSVRKALKRNLTDEFSMLDGVFPIVNLDTDVGDIPDSRAIVTCCDIFWICISIFTHIIDMFTDINLASHYLINKQYGYFIWTSIFLFVPSLINMIISIQMYKQDREANAESTKNETFASRIMYNIALWPLILVMQFAPVLRYIDTLIFAIKSYLARKERNQTRMKLYYLKMLKEEQDIALMRILECFLEAAPHQILQLTIIIMQYCDNSTWSLDFIHQFISILSSLIGMGWAMSSYHRSIRKAQWDRENMSRIGNCLQFIWHFFITVSRVISITVVATLSVLYVGIVIIIHWLIMTSWILTTPAGIMQFCRSGSKPLHAHPTLCERIHTYLLAAVFGVIYVFTYLKPIDGPTYWKHTFYYFVCGLENLAAALIWSFMQHLKNPSSQWFHLTMTMLCTIPFVFGIIVMVIYYKFFHPNMKKIPSTLVPHNGNNNVNLSA